MRTLLIDNHDSFTYNLFHLLARTYGVAPLVLANDDRQLTAALADSFDAVVVSPGPGSPEVARDIGRCLDVVSDTTVPVLGVCLGHQALGHLVGAPVVTLAEPQHGHLSTIRHEGTGLFAGLPHGFTAVRYHSLALSEPLPAPLAADAWSEDGVVMAVHHRSRPWWGIQFHPESVASERGEQLLTNFRALATGGGPTPPPAPTRQVAARRAAPPPSLASPEPPGTGWTLRTRCLPYAVDTEAAFDRLCAGRPYAFWLDSCHPSGELARFSFLGYPDGPDGEVLSYDAAARVVSVLAADGRWAGTVPGSITEVLESRLAQRRVEPVPQLPFDLTGGYVGYLGYETKADGGSPNRHLAATPDAVWVFASRFLAVDHHGGRTWVVAVCSADTAEAAAAERWVDATAGSLHPQQAGGAPASPPESSPPDPQRLLDCTPRQYEALVREAQRQLRAGESYEVCLTAEATAAFHGSALDTYRRQRRLNPAPYSAFLRLGGVEVLCSSPERFLRIDRSGAVESRPIKGTAPHGTTADSDAELRDRLATSAKTRAENLMIVDLLRHDLGRVCEVGSVHVPTFMAVESYATVHQLVSTVRGRLRPDVGAVEAVRACFPGGSMTGAPKLRTMEIIERLEGRARGIYSGALGYLGLTGAADLNIVIRTAVFCDGVLRVGTGGAIVLASDPADEYDEMLLKLRAALCGVRAEDVPRAQ